MGAAGVGLRRLLAALLAVLVLCAPAFADPGNVLSTKEIAHHGAYTVARTGVASQFDGYLAFRNAATNVVGHALVHVSCTLRDTHHSTTQCFGWIKNTHAVEYVFAFAGLFNGGPGSINGGDEIASCGVMREATTEPPGYKFLSGVCSKQDSEFTRHNMTIWFRFTLQGTAGLFWVCHVRMPVAKKIGRTYWFTDAADLPGVGGAPGEQDHVRCLRGQEGGGGR